MNNKITSRLLLLCKAYPDVSVGEIGDIAIKAGCIDKDILSTPDSIAEQLEMVKNIENNIKKFEYKQGTLFN
jgi:hypothetical protein